MPKLIQRSYFPLALIIGVCALVVGGPLAIGALWLWLLVGAADLAWAAVVSAQLAVLYQTPSTHFTAHDPLPVELQLSNEGWLLAPSIGLRDGPDAILPFGTGSAGQQCTLLPQGRATFQRVLTARRGQYRLGPLVVTTEGPFGIFALSRSLYSENVITVLPRLQPLPYWPLEQPEAHAQRAHLPSPFTDPTTLVSTHPMLPGDSPRLIHWKRTARTGTLQIRESEASAGGNTLIVLDLQAEAYRNREVLLDAGTEIVVAIGHSVLHGGGTLTVIGTGRSPVRIGPNRGTHALGELLETMAMLSADGMQPLGAWLADRLVGTSTLGVAVIVTPTAPAEWADALLRLRARGVTTTAVLTGAVAEDDRRNLQRMGALAWTVSSAEALAELLGDGRGRVG